MKKNQGIKFQITGITLAINVLALAVVMIIALFFFDSMGNARSREQEQTLNESFDRLIKQQVEAAVSILESYNAKAVSGELTMNEAKEMAADTIRAMRYGEDGYFWVDTAGGENVVLLGNETEGTNRYDAKDLQDNSYVQSFIENGKQPEGGYTDYYFTKEGGTDPLPKRAYTKHFAPFDWVVGTGNYTDDIALIVDETKGEINDSTVASFLFMIIAAILLLLVSAVLSYLFSKSIAGSVNRLTGAMNHISEGNFNVEQMMLPKDKKGWFGDLVTGFYKLVHNTKAMTDDLLKLNDELNGAGDIEYRIDADVYSGSYRDMMQSINMFIDNLVGDILEVLYALTEISNGNFDVEIKQLQGKKVVLNDQFDLLISNLKNIHVESVTLAKEAAAGNLDVKADMGKYQGDWALLLESLNTLVEAVAEQAHWYESILDAIPFPLSITDTNMNWTFINRATENFLSKTRKEVAGQHCSNWGAGICKTENCGITCAKRGVSQTTFVQAGMDFQVDVAMLKDRKGKDIGFVEVVQDITKLESTIVKLNKVMNNVKDVSRQISMGVTQISNSSQDLAEGSVSQASAIEELNASVDIVNEKTQVTARHAVNASDLSKKAKQNAVTGNDEMKMMLSSMQEIKNASHNISKIIKTIDDIAFQTNLLALNAAVEAARAGEHGKGFAVVAEEVRNLAGRSQVAAKETDELIMDAISRVDEGTGIAANTARSFETIVSDFDHVSQIVDEIAAASSDQAHSITQISTGISQIAQVTQSNSAASQETAAATEELASQSDVLMDIFNTENLE